MCLNLLVLCFWKTKWQQFSINTTDINSLLNINFHFRLVTLMLILFLFTNDTDKSIQIYNKNVSENMYGMWTVCHCSPLLRSNWINSATENDCGKMLENLLTFSTSNFLRCMQWGLCSGKWESFEKALFKVWQSLSSGKHTKMYRESYVSFMYH